MAKPKKGQTARPRIQVRYLDLLRRMYPNKSSYADGQLIEHHIDITTSEHQPIQETATNEYDEPIDNQPAADSEPKYRDDMF